MAKQKPIIYGEADPEEWLEHRGVKTADMNPDQLREKAEKVLELTRNMEEAFPYGNLEEQRILCLMAGLQDAYVSGAVSAETKTKP